MNRRRLLLRFLGCALATASSRSTAQSTRASLLRVAVLAPSTRAREEVTLRPFFDEMRRMGWIDGRTVIYDTAYGDDLPANLVQLATEVVARKPDLIFAPPAPAAWAARQATSTIPIVFATGTDPVGTGLVASLARPGGNVTGVLSVVDSLMPKLVQVLHEVLPGARRLGVLNDPGDPRARTDLTALTAPAHALGLTLVVSNAANPAALSAAVARLVEQRVDAIVTSTSLMFNLRAPLLELTNARRLPVIGHRAELADAGALFAYGASLAEQLRRAATLVDRVLKGASPAEMPVEQPTRFDMVVNLKAARALGVKIPPSVLLRADRVIE